MLTAVASWLSALLLPLTWSRGGSPALVLIVVSTLVLVWVSLAVVVDPPTKFIFDKDRPVYEDSFRRLQVSDAWSDYEVGYAALEASFAYVFAEPGILFGFVACVFLVALYILLSGRYPADASVLLVFLTINFFPFFQGALNVTRQFLAAAILFVGYRFFAKVVQSGRADRRSMVAFIAIFLLASLFHRSVLFLLVPFAAYFAGVSYKQLLLASVALFGLSVVGVSQVILGPFISLDERAAETLWSYDRSSFGLVYSGGTNRIDFMLFTLFPVIANEALRFAIGGKKGDETLVTFYCCLMLPFFALAFIPFSERLAFFAWLLWPVLLCDHALNNRGAVSRIHVLLAISTIGAVAIGQLYGLTATELAFSYLI